MPDWQTLRLKLFDSPRKDVVRQNSLREIVNCTATGEAKLGSRRELTGESPEEKGLQS
jgi:hypothetical protein